MRLLAIGLLVAVGVSGCASKRRAPRHQMSPGTWVAPAPAAPVYGQLFAVPAGSEQPAPAPAPSVVEAAPLPEAPELVACLTEAKSGPQCRIALTKIAETGIGAGRVIDVYQRGCEMKEKFFGCGVFKSTAIRESDEPQMALLMQCEGGRYEACEDAKVKSAPLIAWRATLMQKGCKSGATYLCDNYRACPGRSTWGCEALPGGKACGCLPKCEGTTNVNVGQRKWPDGSPRATFTCQESKSKDAQAK